MQYVLYERIKEMAARRGISLSALEARAGMGKNSLAKWKNPCSPAVGALANIAEILGTSVDYLVGRTDICTPVDNIIADEDILCIQRARERMSPADKNDMMKLLEIGFRQAFREDCD